MALLQILQYIIVKTSHGPRDLHWSSNAIKLALETAILCYEEHKSPEMRWCLNEAKSHQLNFDLLPLSLRCSYLLNGSLLAVLEVLWMTINQGECGSMDIDKTVGFLKSTELTFQQSDAVASAFFNIGQHHFNQTHFSAAFPWLQQAHHFGYFKFSF